MTELLQMADVAWPAARLSDAIDALALASGLPRLHDSEPKARRAPGSIAATIDDECGARGLEAQSVHVYYDEIDRFLLRGGPAIFAPDWLGGQFLVLVRADRARALLLGPDGAEHWLRIDALASMLKGSVPFPRDLCTRIAQCYGVGDRIAERLAEHARNRRVAPYRVAFAWLVRLPPSAPMLASARAVGARWRLALTALLLVASSVVGLVAFIVVGAEVLAGRLGVGTLLGAGAAMLSGALIGALGTRVSGLLQLDLSVMLKSRLFEGVIRMPVDKLRHAGVGMFLGMVTEAAEFEHAALFVLAGAFQTIASIGVGLVLLGAGAAPLTLIGAFLCTCLGLGMVALIYHRRECRSTDLRLASALTIVENLAGQRTRAVQQSPEDWHTAEDALMAAYNSAIHDQDTAAITLRVAPRAWLIVAFGILGIALITGTQSGIAPAVVGIVATYQGLALLAMYLQSSIRVAVAMRAIRDLVRHGRADPDALRTGLTPKPELEPGERLVEMRGVRFAYPTTGRVVLDSATLTVADGDRVLLTGSSGSGKTTLVHVLSGVRQPDAGLLLLRGVDAHALSEERRRRIVATAPQFHENHILTGTLLFNLLLGRGWPPLVADERKAAEICDDLGLGPLIGRMPHGLHQIVGETGWQLSHGERSRVFIARALLQEAPLVIFDESFGALDNEAIQRCMECALKHSRATLVIAHP